MLVLEVPSQRVSIGSVIVHQLLFGIQVCGENIQLLHIHTDAALGTRLYEEDCNAAYQRQHFLICHRLANS